MAKRSSSRKTRTMRRMRGGDAWQHAVGTYGGIGQQQAGQGNVIAQQDVGAPIPMKGGSCKPEMMNGGGLTELAVPAVLLIANHTMKRRGNFRRKSFRRGRSRRYRK